MKLLVTDFDGVVCDSVSECLLAAYNAWGQLQTSYEAQRIFDMDSIHTNLQTKFRKLRPYLRGAEDFIPLFLAVKRDLEVESQFDFDLLRRRLQHQLSQYQQAFYTERDFLRRHHRRLWLQLNPLFPAVKRALAARSSFDHIYILTTKRQPDVVDILEYHGIDFPVGQIHAVASDGKMERLQEIMQAEQVPTVDTGYIEDQVDYLLSAAPLGVDVRLADWGYVSAEQQHSAAEHGIPSIDQAAMTALLQNLR